MWLVDGSDKSWGGELLRMTMEYSVTQWVEENMRFRGEDGPSRLDLIFMKESKVVKDIDYKCPIGKSDHVVVECILRIGEKI